MNHVDTTKESPITSISIGPGIRGIERGVERIARLDHIAYVEIEAFIVENLVAEMEFGLLAPAVIWSDAKTFPCEPFRGITDILFAGYPCQPFSHAGRRKGLEDPRHLYPYIERTIRIIRPRICFFENVRGHITCGLAEVIESLEGLGYRVHWGIFSAEETGAAHKRERVFIMAVRSECLDDTNEKHDNRKRGWLWTKFDKTIMDYAGSHRQQQENEVQTRRNCFKSTSKVANADIIRIDRSRSGNKGRHESTNESTGEELENTNHLRDRRRGNEGTDREREIQTEGSSELGHTDNQGLQGRISGECEERGGERSSGQASAQRVVSKPGQNQYEWECPRTTKGQWETKSGVGGPINGYKFREDFLRALGNSVYPDAAELAFITLMKKFYG